MPGVGDRDGPVIVEVAPPEGADLPAPHAPREGELYGHAERKRAATARRIMRVRSSRPRAFVGVFMRLDGLQKSQGLLGRRNRGGHGPRGTLRPVLERGHGALRGAGGLPRQGRHREALRRRQGAARPPHAARVRRGDPGRQAPRRVRRARAGGVAAQADARERPRRGPRARGLLDGAGAIGRHAREGHRPRVCEVTGRQRDIFDRLGYGLPTTS